MHGDFSIKALESLLLSVLPDTGVGVVPTENDNAFLDTRDDRELLLTRELLLNADVPGENAIKPKQRVKQAEIRVIAPVISVDICYYRWPRLNVVIGIGSIEGWLVIEGRVGTADFASRQSGYVCSLDSTKLSTVSWRTVAE